MEINKTQKERPQMSLIGLTGPQIEGLLNLFQPWQLTGWFVYLLYC